MTAVVIDASAMVDLLLGSQRASAVASVLASARSLHAPHVLDIEVLHALRSLGARGCLTEPRATQAVQDFRDLRVLRYDHAPLLPRIWELRQLVSSYDAAYIAVAEVVHAPLLTSDARLARSHGHRVRMVLAA